MQFFALVALPALALGAAIPSPQGWIPSAPLPGGLTGLTGISSQSDTNNLEAALEQAQAQFSSESSSPFGKRAAAPQFAQVTGGNTGSTDISSQGDFDDLEASLEQSQAQVLSGMSSLFGKRAAAPQFAQVTGGNTGSTGISSQGDFDDLEASLEQAQAQLSNEMSSPFGKRAAAPQLAQVTGGNTGSTGISSQGDFDDLEASLEQAQAQLSNEMSSPFGKRAAAPSPQGMAPPDDTTSAEQDDAAGDYWSDKSAGLATGIENFDIASLSGKRATLAARWTFGLDPNCVKACVHGYDCVVNDYTTLASLVDCPSKVWTCSSDCFTWSG